MSEEDEDKNGKTIGDALYEGFQVVGFVLIALIIAKCSTGSI